MALINCPKCGHILSNTAKRCPHCGYAPALKNDIHKKSSATKIIFILLAVCAILLGLFFAYRVSQKKTGEIASEEYETLETKCAIEELAEEVVIDDPLSYVDSTNYHEVDGETLYLWLCKEREQGRDWRLKESDVNKLTEEQMSTLGVGKSTTEIIIADIEVSDEASQQEIPANNDESEQVVIDEVVTQEANIIDDKVWSNVDERAKFQGGETALMEYLKNNIHYPEDCRDNSIQGRVVVQFIIEKDGSISSLRVVRGKDPSLDKEAQRVVMSMPKFIPAKVGGQPVRSEYTLPITFKITD